MQRDALNHAIKAIRQIGKLDNRGREYNTGNIPRQLHIQDARRAIVRAVCRRGERRSEAFPRSLYPGAHGS